MQKKKLAYLPDFLILFILTNLMSCQEKAAYVRLNPLFTDHVVLQRNIEVPIWGKASPGGLISLKMGNERYSTTAAADSTWQIQIAPKNAGGPYTIEIIGEKRIVLNDVMFGDVWICSGQSNMDWPVSKAASAKNEIANAKFPEIRLFKAHYITSRKPLNEINANAWQVCSSNTVVDFSAVGYFFGKKIHREIGVPIGLIQIAWGGTPAEAWMSNSTLAEFPEFNNEINAIENITQSDVELARFYNDQVKNWEEKLLNVDAAFPEWTQKDFNDRNWRRAYLPAKLEDIRGTESTGVFWFRKSIEIPDDWDKNNLKIGLGKISNMDHFFWNGQLVGFTEKNNTARWYDIPAHFIQKENTIVLRITNTSGSGGITGNYRDFTLKDGKGNSMLLAGYWQYAPSITVADVPQKPKDPLRAGRPTVLYKTMVNPLLPLAFRGVIWYQGEANTSRAERYQNLFAALITDWRNQWKNAGSKVGDFPFLYVQLANYLKRDQVPRNDPWPQLRDAQFKVLDLPNTGMAVAIDLGEANNIHPANKQTVGYRLALNALHYAYFQDLIYSGPIYQSMVVEEGQIRLTFNHIGDGLQIGKDLNKPQGRLKGFAIAGSNQQFVWANAIIEGETIVVKSKLVPKPIAVRYAWSNNPDCNLYNKNGLPASPFRTDSFD